MRYFVLVLIFLSGCAGMGNFKVVDPEYGEVGCVALNETTQKCTGKDNNGRLVEFEKPLVVPTKEVK